MAPLCANMDAYHTCALLALRLMEAFIETMRKKLVYRDNGNYKNIRFVTNIYIYINIDNVRVPFFTHTHTLILVSK